MIPRYYIILGIFLFCIYAILTTSCEKQNSGINNNESKFILGDSSIACIQELNILIRSSRPYDEQTEAVDIDQDGTPDFQLSVVIDGSNGVGYATNHFIESLHDRAFFSSYNVTDTIYYSESYYVDTSEFPVWFQTVQRKDCNQSDSIVSINEVTHLEGYQKGDSIKAELNWFSGKYLFRARSYAGGYKDYETADTIYYVSYFRWQRCFDQPLDEDLFIAVNIVNEERDNKLGWIKIRLGSYDIMIYEVALFNNSQK